MKCVVHSAYNGVPRKSSCRRTPYWWLPSRTGPSSQAWLAVPQPKPPGTAACRDPDEGAAAPRQVAGAPEITGPTTSEPREKASELKQTSESWPAAKSHASI